MKMYKTGGWKELIEVVEVEKVTEKSVWLSHGRTARRSNYCSYWDTMEEAEEHLKAKYNNMIQAAESRIERAQYNLEALDILVKIIKKQIK
jgi:hypothetical protein